MFELLLHVPEGAVESVSDALESLDALSVSVEDADALTANEQAMFGEPGLPAPKAGWQRSTVTALFGTREAADEAARAKAPGSSTSHSPKATRPAAGSLQTH